MFDDLHLPIHASQLYWCFLGVWFTKAERDDFLKSLPKDLRLRPPASSKAEQAHQDRWAITVSRLDAMFIGFLSRVSELL